MIYELGVEELPFVVLHVLVIIVLRLDPLALGKLDVAPAKEGRVNFVFYSVEILVHLLYGFFRMVVLVSNIKVTIIGVTL